MVRELYPNLSQTIHLETGEGAQKKYLRATVLDVNEQGIIINFPIDEATNKIHFLMNGDRVAIVFTHEAKHGIEMYSFMTTVIGKAAGHIPHIVLQKPPKEEITRIQRRRFLRIPASFTVSAALFAPENLNEKKQDMLLTTQNISGGGFRFSAVPHPDLGQGTLMKGTLYFEKDKNTVTEILFEGDIVNILPSDVKKEEMIFGVRFTKIANRDQEALIQYCFRKQIELHRMSSA